MHSMTPKGITKKRIHIFLLCLLLFWILTGCRKEENLADSHGNSGNLNDTQVSSENVKPVYDKYEYYNSHDPLRRKYERDNDGQKEYVLHEHGVEVVRNQKDRSVYITIDGKNITVPWAVIAFEGEDSKIRGGGTNYIDMNKDGNGELVLQSEENADFCPHVYFIYDLKNRVDLSPAYAMNVGKDEADYFLYAKYALKMKAMLQDKGCWKEEWNAGFNEAGDFNLKHLGYMDMQLAYGVQMEEPSALYISCTDRGAGETGCYGFELTYSVKDGDILLKECYVK